MSTPPPRFVEQRLAGWGNHPVETCRVYRPERRSELRAVLAGADDGGCIPRGLGRSYGDASLNAGGAVVLQERLGRLLDFDAEAGVIECEGGTSLADIIDVVLPRGWFLPVTPGTRFVTVGGAIASDVHGKNHHHDGAFTTFVDGLTLLTAAGDVLECSRDEQPDVFWATVGGLGLTGFILAARFRLLRVETSWVRVRTDRARDLDDALAQFEALDHDHRYSVAWIDSTRGRDGLGRCVLMHGEHASADDLPRARRSDLLSVRPPRPKTVPLFAPNALLGPGSIRLFNSAYHAHKRPGERLEPLLPFMYPLDAVLHWNRLYGRRGFIQYQLVLPPETAREGLVRVLERIHRAGAASFLSILKRLGAANEGLLSFPRGGWTLALDFPNTGADLHTLLAELDALVLEHDGRVYLTKDATLARSSFEAMYPRHEEFRAIQRRLDPERRLRSSMARRYGLVEDSVEGDTP